MKTVPVIVCAALRCDESVICGPRHFDKIMRDTIRSFPLIEQDKWRFAEQGFVDQFGKFYTRKDALDIAMARGQIVRRCGGDEKRLFSENIY